MPGSFSQRVTIERLDEASKKGRSIIPLLGTGISVDAGIPSLAELTRYLAKTQYLLRNRLYRSLPPNGYGRRRGQRPDRDDGWEPSQHLRDFGWPDPNQLDSDLWYYLGSAFPEADYRSRMSLLVDSQILSHLEEIDSELVEELRSLHEIYYGDSRRWDFQGSYWKGLLAHLTRSDPDLVDSLFHRLVRRRQPGPAHRYLAFLAPILRLRLYLTVNFDTLIEDALSREGLHPIVYNVSHGAPLPSPSLVHEGISVVKLHGGGFGLRVGESLDSPLDRETRARLAAYLPQGPILLVMGIGGWDLRVLDMVELVVADKESEVYWLHYGKALPMPVQQRLAAGRWPAGRIFGVCVRSPGAFLQELFERCTGSYPSIRRAYRAYDPRPVTVSRPRTSRALGRSGGFAAPNDGSTARGHARARGAPLPWIRELGLEAAPIQVFVDHPEELGLGASLELAGWVDEPTRSHRPVWIDLETKYTIEDVISELMSQLRRYDPTLPPEVLPTERSLPGGSPRAQDFEKVARRVFAALSRGRYVVAFDGLGSFGRPPTEHHGLDRTDETRARAEADFGLAFVAELVQLAAAWAPGGGTLLKDSCLGFSVDARRFLADDRRPDAPFPKVLRVLRSMAEELPALISLQRLHQPELDALSDDLDRERLALLRLSAFRLRRSRVAVENLISGSRLPAGYPTLDAYLDELEGRRWLERLEGGAVWMSRRLRDRLYERFSHGTEGQDLEAIRVAGRQGDMGLFERFADLMEVHTEIGWCYEGVYTASHDIAVLLEMLYHRIAVLRCQAGVETWLAGLGPALPEGSGPSLARALAAPMADRMTRAGALAVLAESRLHRLRRLRATLVRERHRMRSGLSGLSLVAWTNWVRAKDLARFRPRPPEEGRPRGDVQARTEDAIAEEIAALGEVLDSLEGAAQHDRMNAPGALGAAGRRLSRAGGRPLAKLTTTRSAGRADPDALGKRFLGLEPSRIPPGREAVVVSLFLASRAFRRSGDRVCSQHGVLLLEAAARDASEEVSALVERHRADHLLMGVSPWDYKGRRLLRYLELQEAATGVVEACRRALTALGSADAGRRSAASYLHSLKARGHYLRGHDMTDEVAQREEFRAAYSDLDLSRALVSSHPPERREALAVSLLRLAECLMLRSDASLLSFCALRATGRGLGALSHAGKLRLKWHLESEARPQWALDGDPFFERSSAHAPVRQEDVDALRRQSLANWAGHELDLIDSGAKVEVGRELAAVRKRLARAEDVLDSAEAVLGASCRNVEWWACLFQLRAQLAVERLLLMVAGDPGTDRAIEDGVARSRLAAGGPGSTALRQLINRYVQGLRNGLRAVRQAIDVLLPPPSERKHEPLLANPYITRALRLWVELMVCGADLTLRTPRMKRGRRSLDESELWSRWKHLNDLEGFRRLQGTPAVRDWVREWVERVEARPRNEMLDPLGRAPRLAPRARVLEAIDECLWRGATRSMISQLCFDERSLGAPAQ